jgi:hypothetical protein
MECAMADLLFKDGLPLNFGDPARLEWERYVS